MLVKFEGVTDEGERGLEREDGDRRIGWLERDRAQGRDSMGRADLEPDRSHHGGDLRTGSSSTWHRGKQERTPLAGFAVSP